MLTFVTALAHPHNTPSPAAIGRLLSSTLHSLCSQTDDRIRVVVVCNEVPPTDVDDPRVRYVTVGFPPASPQAGPSVPYLDGVFDRGVKLAVGVAAARADGADHVMLLDYDDLVHRGLAAFANDQPDAPGWYVPDGYLHTVGTRHLQPMFGDFHEKCGSSGIIGTRQLDIPDLDPASTKDEIAARVPEETLVQVLIQHPRRHEVLDLAPLPFPGAVWRIGTGANHSGNLVSGRERVPLTDELCATFSLERPGRLSALRRSASLTGQRVRRRLRG